MTAILLASSIMRRHDRRSRSGAGRAALTDRHADALTYAQRLHRAQTRKGNDVPCVAHLMAVCATVLEHGGGEDTVIAALLHDAAEDQGGLETLADVRARFGELVADIVAARSDSATGNKGTKAPWEERKRKHVEHLRSATFEVALITAPTGSTICRPRSKTSGGSASPP